MNANQGRNFANGITRNLFLGLLKNNKPVKAYEDRLWRISVTSKERLSTQTRASLNLGVVITLKRDKWN